MLKFNQKKKQKIVFYSIYSIVKTERDMKSGIWDKPG